MLRVGEDKLRADGWSEGDIENHVSTLQAAVNDVYVLWHNTYRYASENRLLAHLKRLKLYRGIKGDPLKAKALYLLKAADLFITKGILQWH